MYMFGIDSDVGMATLVLCAQACTPSRALLYFCTQGVSDAYCNCDVINKTPTSPLCVFSNRTCHRHADNSPV